MPKHSSKLDKAISPSTEVMRRSISKRIIIALLLVVLGIGLYFFLHPRRHTVESVAPDGAILFVRLDRVEEHLKSLRSSQFWKNASKINVPRFLEHENVSSQKVEQYSKRRANVVGVLDSSVFKQFFGREVAVVLYPQLDRFSNGTWPEAFSGALLITRLNSKSRVAQSLVNIWAQHAPQAEIKLTHYKKIAVTVVKLKKPDPDIYYANVGEVLVAAVDERIIYRTIDAFKGEAKSIEKDEQFLAAGKHIYDSPDGIYFLDVPKARKFILSYWSTLFTKDENKSTSLTQGKVQEILGNADGFNVSGGAFLAGKPIRSKWALMFDAAKVSSDFKRVSVCKASDNSTLRFVPKDVVLYQWMNCFDFSAQYEKIMARHQKKSGEDSSSPFADLEKTWGLTVKDDILPILGQEIGWYVQGVEMGGLFPIPKVVFFLKVKDEKSADRILKKIATTPLTLVESEVYKQSKINFVSVPLMKSFRPSYSFLNDYLIIATSDELIKQSIDVLEDPANGLASQPLYKEMSAQGQESVNAVSFVKIGEIARQSRALVDWADQWFTLKVQQADAEEAAARQKWQALKEKIEAKQQSLTAEQERLARLSKEEESLMAQAQASAVVSEAKDTLSAQGEVKVPVVVPTENQPQQSLELKKTEVAAAQSSVFGIQKDMESLKNQQPELQDDLDDLEKQKVDAENFRYYVDDVVAPILQGLESLIAQSISTTIKDGAVETEVFLKAQ